MLLHGSSRVSVRVSAGRAERANLSRRRRDVPEAHHLPRLRSYLSALEAAVIAGNADLAYEAAANLELAAFQARRQADIGLISTTFAAVAP